MMQVAYKPIYHMHRMQVDNSRATTSPPPPPARRGSAKWTMRTRADQLLVDRGLAESRSRAQALILAGKVFSGERRIAKAGDTLAPDAAAGGPRPGPPLGVTRRAEARPRAAPLRPVAGGPHLPRHRRLHRRLHRCAAGARRGEGACGRCRPRPACLEAAERPARRGAREDQRPLPDARQPSPIRLPPWCATRASSASPPCSRPRWRCARRAPGRWR